METIGLCLFGVLGIYFLLLIVAAFVKPAADKIILAAMGVCAGILILGIFGGLAASFWPWGR